VRNSRTAKRSPGERRCVACRDANPRRSLVRFGIVEGMVRALDDRSRGHFAGRCVHVCPTVECMTAAARAGLARSLKRSLALCPEVLAGEALDGCLRNLARVEAGARRRAAHASTSGPRDFDVMTTVCERLSVARMLLEGATTRPARRSPPRRTDAALQ